MPRCIALGCTSGYRSNNEKVHFFYVPQDENIRKLWQAALKRKDIIINSKQAVCHHHFLSNDILWKREICDEKGNVLGVSASFKIPKLRKGAVPSQFPWTEEILNNIKDSEDNIKESKLISSQDLHIEELCKDDHATVSLFDNIIDNINRKQFHMPSQWMHTQCFNKDTRLLIFFLPICNKIDNNEDRYSLNPVKEAILKEDMTLQINILKQCILNIPSHLRIHNYINNIDQLEETLFSFDNLHICPGIDNDINKIEDLEYNEAFKDICGKWRHKKCLLFSFNLEKCKFCSIVKKSINQKYRRTKIMKSIKRIKIVVPTTEKQQKILLLRKKYYRAEKAKNRAKYIAN